MTHYYLIIMWNTWKWKRRMLKITFFGCMRHVRAKWFGENCKIVVWWGEFVINQLRLCLKRLSRQAFIYNFNDDLVVFEFASDQSLKLTKTRRIWSLNIWTMDCIYFDQDLPFRLIFQFTMECTILLTFYSENVLFIRIHLIPVRDAWTTMKIKCLK